LQLILRAALAEIERLQLMIAGLQRNQFGRRSERLDDETLQHGLEDLQQSVAEQAAGMEAAMAPPEAAAPEVNGGPRHGEPPRCNRGALPAHLPRVELMIDIENKACPGCGSTLHQISEDRAEDRAPRRGVRACGFITLSGGLAGDVSRPWRAG
jgi:hypothetical protein